MKRPADRQAAPQTLPITRQQPDPIQEEEFEIEESNRIIPVIVRRMTARDAAQCSRCPQCNFMTGRDGRGLCVQAREPRTDLTGLTAGLPA